MLTYPKSHFSEPYFGPPGVLRPQIFTRARESPSLTSAPPTGNGGPLQLFSKGGQKLAKKNKGALITSELGGVARRNFGT